MYLWRGQQYFVILSNNFVTITQWNTIEPILLEALKEPPKPWEFRSKPAWQRLIIMLGGVTVNFLLGFLIFGMMLWHYGKEYIPTSTLQYGMQVDSVLMTQGLRNGDLVVKVGNRDFDRLALAQVHDHARLERFDLDPPGPSPPVGCQ